MSKGKVLYEKPDAKVGAQGGKRLANRPTRSRPRAPHSR
jgi:hypothetical protein